MPDRLRGFALVALAVVFAGCAHTSSSEGPSPTATLPSAVSTIGDGASDQRPLITMTSLGLGLDYWAPIDLASVYVYPDASVIRVSRQPPVSDAPHLVAQKFTLDRSQLDALVQAAVDAGLVGGGVQPAVPLPTGVQVADGGRAWFSLRQGDSTTTRVVDQPGEAEADGGTRASFAPLTKALGDLCCASRTDLIEVPLTRWAIVATPTTATADPKQEWTGPDINTLPWEDIGGYQCAIVTKTDWPVGEGERFVSFIVLDGKKVTRRPLLPHESTCTQVVDLLDYLAPLPGQLNSLP